MISRRAPRTTWAPAASREIISRSYNLLLRVALAASCSDAQCGFKALRREAVEVLLPLVDDEAWFFDTEILVTAQRLGLRIHEVPVDWVDDLDSRVAVARTAWLDLCGIARMAGPSSRRRAARARADLPRTPARVEAPGPSPDARVAADAATDARDRADGQVFADELLRFAGVGLVSTLAYVAMFALLEPWIGAYAANAVAIVGCGLGNTAAHRGMAGTARHGLDHFHRVLVSGALLGVSLAFTTVALVGTRALGFDALAPELVAVTLANLAAAAFRFALLRTWVFRPLFTIPVHPMTPDGAGAEARLRVSPLPSAPSISDRTPTRNPR